MINNLSYYLSLNWYKHLKLAFQIISTFQVYSYKKTKELLIRKV